MAHTDDELALPLPTGNTIRWFIEDGDIFNEVSRLLRGIRQWTDWGDAAEVGHLREALTGLPGFPLMRPGDHLEVRYRPAPRIVVPNLPY